MSYRIPTQSVFPQFEFLETLILKTQGIEVSFYESSESPDSLKINTSFFQAVSHWEENDFSHQKWMIHGPEIRTDNGETDILATIFYLVNCCQEWNARSEDLDELGRFKFEKSLQKRFGIIEVNRVQELIELLLSRVGKFFSPSPSKIFISHDIDTIHGALLQDGFALLKRKKIATMMRVVFSEFLKSPAWFNMDQIISLNSEYGVRTTFFWLLTKGRGVDNVMNADYSIEKLNPALKSYEKRSVTNGIHKSSSAKTLQEERALCDLIAPYNRYHFLKYNYVQLMDEMDDAQLHMDGSFGFAEHYGFRNSFGLPFQPYNPKTRKASSFLEVPLNLMDGTFHKYMQLEQKTMADTTISFLESHQENCVLSLLWHNTYFTKYKYQGFLEEYVKIMSFIKESQMPTVTPKELVKSYT